MRSERPKILLRPLSTRSLALVLLGLLVGCTDPAPAPPPARFAAVKKRGAKIDAAERAFCEWTFPQAGKGARPYVEPKERPLPGAEAGAPTTGGWRWVNLWATWCRPCVDEIPLLGRLAAGLEKEGAKISLELWSIDEDEAALLQWLKERPPPGRVRWMEGGEAVLEALDAFGIPRNSPIPIHVLVDAAGQIRCTRVGAIHERDWGSIRALVLGG